MFIYSKIYKDTFVFCVTTRSMTPCTWRYIGLVSCRANMWCHCVNSEKLPHWSQHCKCVIWGKRRFLCSSVRTAQWRNPAHRLTCLLSGIQTSPNGVTCSHPQTWMSCSFMISRSDFISLVLIRSFLRSFLGIFLRSRPPPVSQVSPIFLQDVCICFFEQ